MIGQGMMAAATIAGVFAPALVVRNYDPPSAGYSEQVAMFRCGGDTLRIASYGPARPIGRPTQITLNGRPLKGAKVVTLRRDLASRRAVYRLGARCSRPGNEFGLRVDIGEKGADGRVSFRSGAAIIKNGTLLRYTGLEMSDAETFWFR